MPSSSHLKSPIPHPPYRYSSNDYYNIKQFTSKNYKMFVKRENHSQLTINFVIPFQSLKPSCNICADCYCSLNVYRSPPLRVALCFGQRSGYTQHLSREGGCSFACRVWLGLLCFCYEKEHAPGNATPSPGTRNRIRDACGGLDQTTACSVTTAANL